MEIMFCAQESQSGLGHSLLAFLIGTLNGSHGSLVISYRREEASKRDTGSRVEVLQTILHHIRKFPAC